MKVTPWNYSCKYLVMDKDNGCLEGFSYKADALNFIKECQKSNQEDNLSTDPLYLVELKVQKITKF